MLPNPTPQRGAMQRSDFSSACAWCAWAPRSVMHYLLLLGGFLAYHCAALAQSTVLLPPSAQVGGRTQAEWSRVWWQWAASFDRAESPVADLTGGQCDARQEGPVWFLAGTYGTRRTVRTCTVPAGRYLFFPLINYVVFPRVDGGSNCRSVTAQAAGMTDEVSSLVLEIDGVLEGNLAVHRQATPDCFDLRAAHPSGGRLAPAAANGYYVMLRPLAPGTHTINFGGALPGMLQAVTYTLHVK